MSPVATPEVLRAYYGLIINILNVLWIRLSVSRIFKFSWKSWKHKKMHSQKIENIHFEKHEYIAGQSMSHPNFVV
jgi:hypothetical protein